MANKKSDSVAFTIIWQLTSFSFPPEDFSALKFSDHESRSRYFLFIEL